jgi:hypothetical protein
MRSQFNLGVPTLRCSQIASGLKYQLSQGFKSI